MARSSDLTYGIQESFKNFGVGVSPGEIVKNPFVYQVDPGVDVSTKVGVNSSILNTQVPGFPTTTTTAATTPTPATTNPTLFQRLLGTQMQMLGTGVFSQENDYTGVSNTITRKGAHISVANQLAKIKFVPGTFGGMQNRVAIIRYWTKKDATRTGADFRVLQTSTPITKLDLANRIANLTGASTTQSNILLASTILGPGPAFPIPQSGVVNPVVPAPVNPSFPPAVAPKVNPPQQVPWSFPSGQNITGEPGANFNPSGSSSLPPWSFPTGQVYNANPGSVNNTLSSALSSPTQAAWQFLFNPEELQLESGPEFNRAETWGVSDLPGSGAANSGQPLAWRFNKNRKLIFGKVLLTGYVLGRRVDSLEKGLQQLFMARSGPGMDGPPVLEFVWGSRVFGPCVIQNLRVRERAWDDGYLVNAEVSFDLEQVPEWTINDGAVDIARPGRQSLVNDPFLPRAEPEQSASAGTTPPPPQDQPGGGGGQPVQGPLASQIYDQRKCQRAYFYAGLFKQFESRVSNTNIFFTTRDQIRGISTEFLVKYQNAVQELGSDFSVSSEATRIYSRVENILNPNRPEGRLDGNQIKSYMNGYISGAYRQAQSIYNNSAKCPGTAGKTVLQRQSPSVLSNPTNL